MKWYQKKLRGWVVPFWVTDTPLGSFRASRLSKKEIEDALNMTINHTSAFGGGHNH